MKSNFDKNLLTKGEEIYKSLIFDQKKSNKSQDFEILFQYFITHEATYVALIYSEIDQINREIEENESKFHEIMKICPKEFLPNLFFDFQGNLEKLIEKNDENLLFLVLSSYYEHCSKQHKNVGDLVLKAYFPKNIQKLIFQDLRVVKLVLERDNMLNKEDTLRNSEILKIIQHQEKKKEILILFLKAKYLFCIEDEFFKIFSKQDLDEIFLEMFENDHLDLKSIRTIIKFYLENDNIGRMEQIMKMKKLELEKFEFEGGENLFFYCKSLKSVQYLSEKKVSTNAININKQSALHFIFRSESCFEVEFVDGLMNIFPKEMLNQFDIHQKTPTNILINYSKVSLAKHLINQYDAKYSEPEIFQLPNEVLEFIFTHFSFKDLSIVSRTNQQFHEIANSKIVWQYFCSRDFKYSEDLFRDSFKTFYHSLKNSNEILKAKKTEFSYGPFFEKGFCNKTWRDFEIEVIIQKLILENFKPKAINMNHKFIKENQLMAGILENEYHNELLLSIQNFKSNLSSPYKKVEKYWRDQLQKQKFKEISKEKMESSFPSIVLEIMKLTIEFCEKKVDYKIRYFSSKHYFICISDDTLQLFIY
jgi:hypothetical protein